jgi:polyhydroxybutyrate depolymerase
LAIYPDGYGRTWNDGRGNTAAGLAEVDDVGFIRSLIDDAARVADGDPSRVGAAGISDGAVMCHRLGLELSDRISAIAAVAGTLPTHMVGITPRQSAIPFRCRDVPMRYSTATRSHRIRRVLWIPSPDAAASLVSFAV